MQKPTVGRIVHYTSASCGTGYPDGVTHAAIVIGEGNYGGLYLDVRPSPLGQAQAIEHSTVPFAETATPGHWNWPPRD